MSDEEIRDITVTLSALLEAAKFYALSGPARVKIAESAVGQIIPPAWHDDDVLMVLHHYGFTEYVPTAKADAPLGSMLATNEDGEFFFLRLTQKGREFALEGKHRDVVAGDVIFNGKSGSA